MRGGEGIELIPRMNFRKLIAFSPNSFFSMLPWPKCLDPWIAVRRQWSERPMPSVAPSIHLFGHRADCKQHRQCHTCRISFKFKPQTYCNRPRHTGLDSTISGGRSPPVPGLWTGNKNMSIHSLCMSSIDRKHCKHRQVPSGKKCAERR
jgi:hypothetical protein